MHVLKATHTSTQLKRFTSALPISHRLPSPTNIQPDEVQRCALQSKCNCTCTCTCTCTIPISVVLTGLPCLRSNYARASAASKSNAIQWGKKLTCLCCLVSSSLRAVNRKALEARKRKASPGTDEEEFTKKDMHTKEKVAIKRTILPASYLHY